MTLFIYIECDLVFAIIISLRICFVLFMATESLTFKASLTGTSKRNGGVDTIPTCTSTDKVARWRLEAAQENLPDPEGNRAKPDAANAGATETGLVAATAPRKLLTVHRRLLLDTKRLIKSLESC